MDTEQNTPGRRNLPVVGQRITLEGKNNVLCEKASNGSLSFLTISEHEGDERVSRLTVPVSDIYSIEKEGMPISDQYGYSKNNARVEFLEPRTSAYHQAYRMVKRRRS